MGRSSKRFLMFVIVLAVISALLVWLPSTNTLFDSWRIIASFVTGIVATFGLFGFLIIIST